MSAIRMASASTAVSSLPPWFQVVHTGSEGAHAATIVDPTGSQFLPGSAPPRAGAADVTGVFRVQVSPVASTSTDPMAISEAPDHSDLIAELVEAMRLLNGAPREQAETALRALVEHHRSAAVDALPPVACTWREDGSLLVEWILPRRRLALSIATSPANSLWSLVSMVPGRLLSESGRLDAIELDSILRKFSLIG